MPKTIIAVIGAAQDATESDMKNALKLGEMIAKEGWVLLTGGRDMGIMSAVNRGAKKIAGSLTIGLPSTNYTMISPDIDIVIQTDFANAASNVTILSSTVVIACGTGGTGTASEVTLALRCQKPVILLNVSTDSARLYQKIGRGLVHIAPSLDDVVTIAKRLIAESKSLSKKLT